MDLYAKHKFKFDYKLKTRWCKYCQISLGDFNELPKNIQKWQTKRCISIQENMKERKIQDDQFNLF